MRTFLIVALLNTALLAGLAPLASAQRGGTHFSGRGSFGSGFGPYAGRSGYPAAGLLPLADPLYSDYLLSTGYPVAARPPVIVVQGSSPQPAPAPQNAASTEPLMIELQGDRYVQVSGNADSTAQMIDRSSSQSSTNRSSTNHSASNPSPANLAPRPSTLLIFRDGHHEEISDYTITGGTLYAAADYYSAGSWNRAIQLSSLNLPETVASNQSRGLRFQLPTASNEVIVGP